MNADERKMMRKVMSKVHPDLFVANPYESQCNSDSLKLLFAYVKALSEARSPVTTKLQFYVKEGAAMRLIEAVLPSSGASVMPLFYAFEYITEEELRMATAMAGGGAVTDTNFLLWMRDTVSEAVRVAEQHESLKLSVRVSRADLERKYGLTSVQVGTEYALSLVEQERQLEALRNTDSALAALAAESADGTSGLEGLAMQLYHVDTAPVETFCTADPVAGISCRTGAMATFVAEDGVVHIVADPGTLPAELRVIEVDKARILGQVATFWQRRVHELLPILSELLGVRSVWCDTKSNVQSSQKFVLWAGYVLEKRDEIRQLLKGQKFAFSMIVLTTSSGPLINYHASSPILNIRADCPPAHLIEFLLSETGSAASEASSEVHSSRVREEALLESVRALFDAKCVIKICMNDKVVEGARRLMENAEVIKQTVDLRGACIALDDCYEVWESGFISIPYNFRLQDLPGMVRKLQSGQRQAASSDAPPAEQPVISDVASTSTTSSTSTSEPLPQSAAGKQQGKPAQPSGSGRRAMSPVRALPDAAVRRRYNDTPGVSGGSSRAAGRRVMVSRPGSSHRSLGGLAVQAVLAGQRVRHTAAAACGRPKMMLP